MPAAKGDTIPNTKFSYIQWTEEIGAGKSCGIPQTFMSHERWAGKKVVIVSLPGAFTPVCTLQQIPGYFKKLDEFKAKGVDELVIIAANDAFVMSAWGVQQNVEDKVTFASDIDVAFSRGIDATMDMTARNMGVRTGRYALIVDDLKVVDLAIDGDEMVNSSPENTLKKL